MLIGLSDIIAIFKPGWPHRLHKISHLVPGTLTNVTRSADVIIGLMLLLLAHGLRRRKRRAWQAVAALLAFDIGIHFYHSQRIPTAMVAVVLLIALLYFRDEFYAEGDQRNRWRALWVFAALVVADVAIGLTYILLAQAGWRPTTRSASGCGRSSPAWSGCPARCSGCRRRAATCSPSSPARSACSPWSSPPTCSCARPSPGRGWAKADAAGSGNCSAKHGDRDSLGYFALRNDKSVIWSPTGKACICYRVVSGVMLASGDPIGDPEAWPGAIGPSWTRRPGTPGRPP
jgi:lysyl-tRNA synthetase class 2